VLAWLIDRTISPRFKIPELDLVTGHSSPEILQNREPKKVFWLAPKYLILKMDAGLPKSATKNALAFAQNSRMGRRKSSALGCAQSL